MSNREIRSIRMQDGNIYYRIGSTQSVKIDGEYKTITITGIRKDSFDSDYHSRPVYNINGEDEQGNNYRIARIDGVPVLINYEYHKRKEE